MKGKHFDPVVGARSMELNRLDQYTDFTRGFGMK